MFAAFIYRLISGLYPEKHFGVITPNCKWVKFTDKDYQEWVGSFQEGWDGFGSFIIILDKQDKAFIVAGGQSYLIEISSRQLLNIQAISGTKSALLNDEQTVICFSDSYSIRLLDLEGNTNVLIDKYYFDEIKLIEIKENVLYAKYWHYQGDKEEFELEINLLSKEIKDSFNDQSRIAQTITVEKKKISLAERIKKWAGF